MAAPQGKQGIMSEKKTGAPFLLGQVIGFVKKNKNLCYKDLARFLRNDLFLAGYFLISGPLFLAGYFLISGPLFLAASFWYLVSLINTRIT